MGAPQWQCTSQSMAASWEVSHALGCLDSGPGGVRTVTACCPSSGGSTLETRRAAPAGCYMAAENKLDVEGMLVNFGLLRGEAGSGTRRGHEFSHTCKGGAVCVRPLGVQHRFWLATAHAATSCTIGSRQLPCRSTLQPPPTAPRLAPLQSGTAGRRTTAMAGSPT